MTERVINLQLALFFSNLLRRPDKLINDINEATGNLFDGVPHILDLPPDVPNEFPAVTLKSEDNMYICTISRGRLDFLYNLQPKSDKDWADISKNFSYKSQLLLKYFEKEHNFIRFGLVGNFFIEDKNPIWQLNRKYMKNEHSDLQELLIRYNKIKNIFGLSLNNITHIEIANQQIIQDQGESGIIIQRDINNIPSENNLIIEDIIKIIDSTLKEDYSIDEIKKLVK